MHSSRGQGTVEYLGVVALVALVGGAAATVAPAAGRDIARAVPREVIRALCLVGGGDCDRDRRACPVRSQALRAGATVRVAFVRLGRHHVLAEELRSDGTVALTLVEERAGGAEAGTGARAALRLGASELAIGGGVRAAALVRAGRGSTWIVPRGARAAALRARLRAHFRAAPARELAPGFLARRVLPELPSPTETFGDSGLEVSARRLGLAWPGLDRGEPVGRGARRTRGSTTSAAGARSTSDGATRSRARARRRARRRPARASTRPSTRSPSTAADGRSTWR